MRCARKTCLNNLSLKSKLLESQVKAPDDASQCSKIHVNRDVNLLLDKQQPEARKSKRWQTLIQSFTNNIIYALLFDLQKLVAPIEWMSLAGCIPWFV